MKVTLLETLLNAINYSQLPGNMIGTKYVCICYSKEEISIKISVFAMILVCCAIKEKVFFFMILRTFLCFLMYFKTIYSNSSCCKKTPWSPQNNKIRLLKYRAADESSFRETHKQTKKTHKEFNSHFILRAFGLGGWQRTLIQETKIFLQFVQIDDLRQLERNAIQWCGLVRGFHYL